jgi:valyl-tRNA synthetase
MSFDLRKLPRHYDAASREEHFRRWWEQAGVYRYDPDHRRDEAFVVDTPPPTVSGSLHVGHVFSYTQADVVTRYQRMRGKHVFYPMGWDDNGLPTERRVQNYFHVRCDPSHPYEPGLELSMATGKAFKSPPRAVSRRNFIELCALVTREDEQAFMEVWQTIGLSVDWHEEYATIDDASRHLAQYSFLDLYRKGHLYTAEAPTMWDVDFRTAVAQAEVQDRPTAGHYHDLAFAVEGSDRELVISTTRPELLAACVGVAAHPADARYRDLFGKRAVTPLFRARVPIFATELADPEKGTGILMVCTFGDTTDVQWWQEQGLPLRQILGRDGRLQSVTFGSGVWDSADPDAANRSYAELAGKNLRQARAAIVTQLRSADGAAAGDQPPLRGEPRAIEHTVRYYEQGDRPLEFITTRQWFVRLTDKRQELIERGREIQWHPGYMLSRYVNWTENLQFDWCISRQRFFGVPFPVWYALDEHGTPNYEQPLLAPLESLPMDPLSDTPPGYEPGQRDRPDGFTAEADVFDTWFTSSLTPQIGSGWILNPERHERLSPMDIRPQAHDIIRTWAFYTIAKAHLHFDTIPWRHALISGWILDPDRKKMSKSRGNTVTPQQIIETHHADAARYWAASARLGVDTAYDESVFKIGRRLVTKLYNAGKFVTAIVATAHAELGERPGAEAVSEELDRGFLQQLRGLVERATAAFDDFDYASALAHTEEFFWDNFTDSYIELAKNRAKGSGDVSRAARASAVAALDFALRVLVRLFAPVLPYITEEVWSWDYARRLQAELDGSDGDDLPPAACSVHRAAWPAAAEFAPLGEPADSDSFAVAKACLAAIHRHKTQAAVSVARAVDSIRLAAHPSTIRVAEAVAGDVISAVRAESFELVEDDSLAAGQFAVRAAEFAART